MGIVNEHIRQAEYERLAEFIDEEMPLISENEAYGIDIYEQWAYQPDIENNIRATVSKSEATSDNSVNLTSPPMYRC